jgi:2'-5' RNA ligase
VRLFIALDIYEAIRGRIARFMDGVREFAPDERWVRPESLHVTLKFIGERPEEDIERIKTALAGAHQSVFDIAFSGYGFFPTAKSARVFWVGIQSGPQLPALAKNVDQAVAALGIPLETHQYSPHLTLARGGSGSPKRRSEDAPNRRFQRLQGRLSGLTPPEFGTMTAREFFLYQSQLSRGGSRYTKIARFELH